MTDVLFKAIPQEVNEQIFMKFFKWFNMLHLDFFRNKKNEI